MVQTLQQTERQFRKVNQLTTEIDRVSETTKFNETYLLKGDSKTTKEVNFYKSGYAMPKDLYLEGSTSKIDSTNDLKAALAAGKKVYKAAAESAGKKQADNLIAKKGIDYAYVTKLYDDAGKELSADEAAAATGEVYADKDKKFKVADTGAAAKTAGFITPETVNDDLKFNLHVGADSEMTNKIGVTIQSMSSAGIGVKGLDVSTEDDATNAIDTITNAIQKVSSQRSSLGAVQNRLEHTINNLDNVVENTTSAESRIRDTDMAKEMVNYSKNNILAQAGQSMLAQANQSNQGVLSLLQ